MASLFRQDLQARLLDWVRRQANDWSAELDYDTNLMERSVLDSVAFIDLIAFLEEQTGQRVDLESAALEDVVSIRGLCRLVSASQGEAR